MILRTQQFEFLLIKEDKENLDLSNAGIEIYPTDTLTIVTRSDQSSDITAGICWEELF